MKLVADCLIDECEHAEYDLIVLPGGMLGAERLRDSAMLMTLLRQQQAAGKLYAALCASPAVVLVAHGLAAGRAATAHPAFVEHITPLVSKGDSTLGRVVIDGNLVTSRGPGTVRCGSITLRL
jgi:4-methyl-5(b-hydroxyethyl)-thiazole monophosphate biosynthesis